MLCVLWGPRQGWRGLFFDSQKNECLDDDFCGFPESHEYLLKEAMPHQLKPHEAKMISSGSYITIYMCAFRAGLSSADVGAVDPDDCVRVDVPPGHVAIRAVDNIDISLGEAMVVASDAKLPPGLWMVVDPTKPLDTVSITAAA